MRRRHYIAIFLCIVLASSARTQEPNKRLTNQDIIEMVNLGLSEDVIIAKIRSVSSADAVRFDTSVDGLKALKAANVPDAVIKVMINPAPPPAPVIAAATAISVDPNLPPPEVGVYWKDGANFVLIQGRAISQEKAGGRAASYFTYGMRGQHWDATLEGPTSNNHVKDRKPLFYFYVPDGASAADYVLIKLEKKSDHREFQGEERQGNTNHFRTRGNQNVQSDAGERSEAGRVRFLHGHGRPSQHVRGAGVVLVGRQCGRQSL
jgi:hypothetical protein